MKFTAKAVEAIKPNGKQQEIPDAAFPGLYLRVMPSGAKSWTLRYRANGIQRRYALGKYPLVSLAEARQQASAVLGKVDHGHDPQADRMTRYSVLPTNLRSAVAIYIDLHAKQHTVRWQDTQRMFELDVFPFWGDRKIETIKRRDVVQLIEHVHQRAPIKSNRVLAAVRHFFAWSVSRDALDFNPATGVKAIAPEVRRERALNDQEIALLLRAFERVDSLFSDGFKLLLLTGVRRSEVFEMTWDEVDFENAVWTVPTERTKKKHFPHVVPMSQPVMGILARLYDERTSHLVFPSTSGSGKPISGFSKSKRAHDTAMEQLLAEDEAKAGLALAPEGARIRPWALHDLRRTCATGLQKIGTRLEVNEAVLHHVSGARGGVTGIYQQYDWKDEKREALDQWASHVLSLYSPAPK